MRQFARWTRVMLEHERAFISQTLDASAALLSPGKKDDLMHDLGDIDVCLANLDEPLRVRVP